MALVTFFISPFDDSKKIEITSKGTLRYAMKELGIENDPVCVVINGMCPDEIDLDIILEDTDIVEIRRLVNGGGRSQDKSAIATVIQIAAVAVAVLYPPAAPFAAYILTGATIVSGALNKWAADLAAAEARGADSKVDIKTDNYSLTNATNQARPLQPIPVPIGSHMMAPDIYSEPRKSRYDLTYNESFFVYGYQVNSGLVSSNGPEAPNNSWATMPAHFIRFDFPRYQIKIAPYRFTDKITALTNAENNAIINQIKNFAGDMGRPARVGGSGTVNSVAEAYPIVIYHSDPADPYYRRFGIFFSLERLDKFVSFADPNKWSYLGDLYNGNFTAGFGYFFDTVESGAISINTSAVRAFSGESQMVINGFPYLGSGSDKYLSYSNYLKALNGGSYTSTPKTTAPSFISYAIVTRQTSISTGKPYSTQLYNFGFGDLNISNRRIGSLLINISDVNNVATSSIDKSNANESIRWRIPNVTTSWGTAFFPFMNINREDKNLSNPLPSEVLISSYDLGNYNWSIYAGKRGTNAVSFAIAGRIYNGTSSGFSENNTIIQVQYKRNTSLFWTPVELGGVPIIQISNNNSNEVYKAYYISDLDLPLDSYLEFRIRKATPDSTDNSNGKVSNLVVRDVCFYNVINPPISSYRALSPMNIDGLLITSIISDYVQTNKYMADVYAKCWVYNFSTETWSWTFTRNPAFWFLYYARGGFYNFNSMGSYTYPYSPTYGWQNYPDHPDNTERIFGGGYTNDRIDMDKILEWAFFCESEGLTCDLILKDETSVSATLEKIANLGRASVSYQSGKISVVYEDQNSPAICLFGMGNIISGSFNINYGTGEQVRKVLITYVDRDREWEQRTVESIVPFSSAEDLKIIELTLDGVTEESLAKREANLLAARQFYQKRIYSWQVDFEGLLAKRGDVVLLSHDSTQYGYSGRVSEFVVEAGTVVGIKTTAQMSDVIEYVTIRDPAGGLNTFQASFQNGVIVFNEPYPINMAPYYVNLNDINASSDFDTEKSIAEDFVFIADIKATPGKKVRISGIEVDEDNVFTITAVDEDPAMWAYEYDNVIPSESFNDSILLTKVFNARSLDLGQGNVKLLWETEGAELIQVINVNTGLPLEANGQYSFSGGEVVLELISGIQYELELMPIAIGTAYRSTPQRIKVWPK